jgi:V/A-type H+/Na+-transporting ATPase subunit C
MALKLRIRGARKTNYPYAVARVQAKRAKLIPRSEYEKLLKMDVSEITRYIEESTYKTEVDELSSRFKGLDLLEAALAINEERTYRDIRAMVDGDGGALLNLFLARHEVQNMKTILRGKHAKASRDELVKELLLEDLDTYNLYTPLLHDDVQSMEDIIAAMERSRGGGSDYAALLRDVPPGSSLSAYEDALDKAYYARVLKAAEDSPARGAIQFGAAMRLEIDARNLLNAARWVASGQTGDFQAHVVPGGRHLKVADVIALSRSGSLDAFADVLKDNEWGAAVSEGLDQARKEGRLAPLQSAIQRHLSVEMDRLSHANPLSIVPILLFLVNKHREVTTLRALARGRAAGLSEERLREVIA